MKYDYMKYNCLTQTSHLWTRNSDLFYVALLCSRAVRQNEYRLLTLLNSYSILVQSNTIYHLIYIHCIFRFFIMTSVAVFLLIAVITIPGHSYPVERDKDVINNEQPAISHENN